MLGLTTQDRFLIANGILDAFRVEEPERRHDPRGVKRRLQAMQLIHPSGMGRIFRVLALAKGCAPELDGLRDLERSLARELGAVRTRVEPMEVGIEDHLLGLLQAAIISVTEDDEAAQPAQAQ